MADETPKPDPNPRRRKYRDAPLEGSAVEVPAQDVSAPVEAGAASVPETQTVVEPLAEPVPHSGPDVVATETKADAETQKPAASGPGLVLVLVLMLAGGLGGAAGLYFSLIKGLLPLPNAQNNSLAALEKTVASLAARPVDAGLSSRIEAAEGRIKALEQKPAPAAPDLAALRAEIAALKQGGAASAASGQAAQPVADPRQQAALEERLKNGEAEVKALTIRLTQIDAEIASLGAAVRDASGQRAALTQKLGQLDEKAAKSSTVGNKAALALAISTLRNALDNGQSFANEYRALRALAGDDPDLKSLEAASRTGIPATPVLRQRFRTLLPQLVKAIPASQSEGWFAKAKQSLEGLISIRQVGETAGNDPQAVLARIDALLQRNDLAKVLEEFTRLPEPVQQAGKEWQALVASRLAAETLMNTMARSALQALAEPPK